MPRTVREKLSLHVITKHASDDDIREIVDLGCPGLLFRFHASRKSGSWYSFFYENGRMKPEKFANWPTHSVDDARDHVKAELDKRRGRDAKKDQASEFSTVADLMQWFCERVSKQTDISPARKRSMLSVIKNRILPLIGSEQISTLDKRRIDAAFWLPLQADYQLSTVMITLRVLKQAFALATDHRLIPDNPIADIKQATFTNSTIEPKPGKLKPYQIATVTSLITELSIPVMLVLLPLLFGTRIGETRQTAWAEFDLIGGVWYVPKEHTKARREFTIALSDFSVSILNAYRCWQQQQGYNGSYLFPDGQGHHLSDRDASRFVRRFSHGQWASHDLRKLFSAQLLKLNVNDAVRELMLNHALDKLHKTYLESGNALEEKRAAIELYHQWLQESGLTINKLEYKNVDTK